MPITLPTIRFQNSSNKVGLKFTYNTYTNVYISFSVGPGTFTNSSLLTEINNMMAPYLTPYPGLSISFTSFSTSFGNICSISNNCTSLTIDNSTLTNYILGYTNKYTSASSSNLQGSTPINVNAIDTCVYIQITNIPVTNNNNSQPFTFKLPLTTLTNGNLLFNDSKEHQKIFFYKNTFVLDRLNIVVYDRLGYPLAGYCNWTMTLLIEYEENQKQ